MYTLIDGKKVSTEMRKALKEEFNLLKQNGREGKLAVIQVGNDNASSVYVLNKKKACEEVGLGSVSYYLPEDIEQSKLIELIKELNATYEVIGILVQLPLPKHINSEEVINAISPEKDVDCFHPRNVGNLVLNQGGFAPCTPAGIVHLLKYYNIPLRGKHVVIVGRSNIVGKHLIQLALKEDAAVTIIHSKVKNIKAFTQIADILIVAVGKSKFITEEYIKEGAVVIDVGINRDENNKLCGDVDFENVKEKTSYITPVPGGVGPMTITSLLANCLNALYLRV